MRGQSVDLHETPRLPRPWVHMGKGVGGGGGGGGMEWFGLICHRLCLSTKWPGKQGLFLCLSICLCVCVCVCVSLSLSLSLSLPWGHGSTSQFQALPHLPSVERRRRGLRHPRDWRSGRRSLNGWVWCTPAQNQKQSTPQLEVEPNSKAISENAWTPVSAAQTCLHSNIHKSTL